MGIWYAWPLSVVSRWHTTCLVFPFCDTVIKPDRLVIWLQYLHVIGKNQHQRHGVVFMHSGWLNCQIAMLIKKLFARRCFYLTWCHICWQIYILVAWWGIWLLRCRALVSWHTSPSELRFFFTEQMRNAATEVQFSNQGAGGLPQHDCFQSP